MTVVYTTRRVWEGAGRGRRSRWKRRGPCVHCGRVVWLRARRLCWTCSKNPAVRESYPMEDDPRNTHGNGAANLTPPLPALPTKYPPGSPEKVRVMELRVARGVQPHHPLDGS